MLSLKQRNRLKITGQAFSDEHLAKLKTSNRVPWNKGLTLGPEYRAICSESHKGKTLSTEHRKSISKATKGRPGKTIPPEIREKIAISVARYITRWTPTVTWPEQALAMLLGSAGLEFVTQKRFGRYIVDAWVPSYSLVFEADGNYWHRDRQGAQERDAKRDEYLLLKGVTAVIHLGENDLEGWRVDGTMR